MKNNCSILCFVTILGVLSPLCVVYAQVSFWEQVVGSNGGRVMSLGINENGDLFTGTQFGEIYRSTDNGENWESLIGTDRFGNEMRSVLALDDSTIFVGSGYGVLRSTDNGNNWENVTSGFFSEAIGALAVHPDGRIFALGSWSGDVMYSSDRGDTWNFTNQRAKETDCWDMVIDSSGRIFVASMGGIQRSINSGDSWDYVGRDSGLSWAVSVELDPSGTVYAGTMLDGIFRSDDNGDTWKQITNGIDENSSSIFSLMALDTNTVFAGSYSGVYRSTDRGENWNEINQGLLGIEYWGLEANSNGDIFAGSFAGVARSFDNGDTWILKSNGFSASTVNDIAVHNIGEIYVASDFSGVLRSLDSGVSWEQKGNGLESPEGVLLPIVTIGVDNYGDIYAIGNSSSFFKSKDKGDTWITLKRDDSNFLLSKDIAINERNHLFVGTEFGIIRSLDGGNTWKQIHYPGIKNNGAIDFKFNGDIYLIDYSSDIYRSSDNGDTWQRIYDSSSNAGFLTIDLSSVGFIFANTGDGFVRSFDNGNNWTTLSLPAEPTTVEINSEDEIFIGISGGKVFVSSDFGDNWADVSSGLPRWSSVNAFALDLDTYLFVGLSEGGLFRSSLPTAVSAVLSGKVIILDISDFPDDEGGAITVNWSASSFEGIPGDSNVTGYGIYRWDETAMGSTGQSNQDEKSAAMNGNYLSSIKEGDWVYLADTDAVGNDEYSLTVPTLRDSSSDGINFTTLMVRSTTVDKAYFIDSEPSYGYSVAASAKIGGIDQDHINLPHEYLLLQNYPNPFNPVTTIKYSLPKSSDVSLVIYNITGQEVIQLVNGNLFEGTHTVTWDASNVASGIYLYQLRAGDFVQTRKMVLLK